MAYSKLLLLVLITLLLTNTASAGITVQVVGSGASGVPTFDPTGINLVVGS